MGMTDTKRKSKKLFFSIITLIILISLTSFFLLKNYDIAKIIDAIEAMRYEYVFYGVVCLFSFMFFGAVSMKTVISALGSKVSIIKAFKYSCADIYFSGITPAATGGQPFVSYYMKKDGIPIYRSTIAILLTTMTYKIVLVTFGILGFVLYPDIYFGTKSVILILALLGLSINILLIALCAFCMFSKRLAGVLGKKAITLLGRVKIFKEPQKKRDSFDTTLKNYGEAAAFIKSDRSVLLKSLAAAYVQRISMFSVSYCIYRGLGLNSMTAAEIILLQAAISICVDSIPLPGAAGVTELAFLTLYVRAYPNNEIRATAMLITRGITYYLNILSAGFIVLLNHIKSITFGKEVNRCL